MTFGPGKGFGWKVQNSVGGEAGPGGKEILADGFRPGRDGWAETIFVFCSYALFAQCL